MYIVSALDQLPFESTCVTTAVRYPVESVTLPVSENTAYVAGVPDLRIVMYPSCAEFVPSSQDAMKSETSGLPVSDDTASNAIWVTLEIVAWVKRISPVPGSAIEVELSNTNLNAEAPVDASALVALAALAVAEYAEFVAWVLAVEADELAELAELAAAVAELAAAVWLVVALAESTKRTHLAASVFVLIGTDPELVCATMHK